MNPKKLKNGKWQKIEYSWIDRGENGIVTVDTPIDFDAYKTRTAALKAIVDHYKQTHRTREERAESPLIHVELFEGFYYEATGEWLTERVKFIYVYDALEGKWRTYPNAMRHLYGPEKAEIYLKQEEESYGS